MEAVSIRLMLCRGQTIDLTQVKEALAPARSGIQSAVSQVITTQDEQRLSVTHALPSQQYAHTLTEIVCHLPCRCDESLISLETEGRAVLHSTVQTGITIMPLQRHLRYRSADIIVPGEAARQVLRHSEAGPG